MNSLSKNKGLALLILVWGLLFAWRPFFLGFYHDDWVMLGLQYADFGHVFFQGSARPLLVTLIYAALKILPDTAFAWHVVGSLISLIMAICVYYCCSIILCRLFSESEKYSNSFASLLAAVLWLGAPWALGFNAWPVMFFAQCSVGFFCLSIVALLSELDIKKRLALIAFFQLCGYALYEAFWLGWIPLYLIYIFTNRDLKSSKNKIVVAFVFFLLQTMAITVNRYAASMGAVSKSLQTGWIDGFYYHIVNLPNALLQPYGTYALLLLILPAIATIPICTISDKRLSKFLCLWTASALLIFFLIIKYKPWPLLTTGLFFSYFSWLIILSSIASIYLCGQKYKTQALSLLACIVGVLFSVMLNLMAGYGVTGAGLFSRTSMALTLWLSIGFAIIVAHTQRLESPKLRNILFLAIIATCMSMTYSQLKEWRSAWMVEQNTILRLKPLAVDPTGTYLIETDGRSVVEGFSAFWDIEAAIKGRTYNDKNDKRRFFASRNEVIKSTWDGENFSQRFCNNDVKVWEFPAQKVYILPLKSTLLIAMRNDTNFGCKKR